jgi:hypothetical protein
LAESVRLYRLSPLAPDVVLIGVGVIGVADIDAHWHAHKLGAGLRAPALR